MSLFGNLGGGAQNKASSGGLFGATAAQHPPTATSAPALGGLFGNSTATQQPQTGTGGTGGGGGLFGGALGQNTQGQQQQQQQQQSQPQQQQQQAKPSLFGGTLGAGTSAPASTGTGLGGGLFGNAGAATTGASGGGLFGNTQAAAPAAGTGGGGLFGTAQSSAPAAGTGGGLFGTAQSSAPAASTGGGLFGNVQSSAPAAAPSTGGGLFGAKPAAAPAPASGGGGLFGASTTAQNQQNQQPSGNTGGGLFGTSRPGPQSLFGTVSTEAGGNVQQTGPDGRPSQPAFFDQLLERGKKRQQEQEDGVGQFGELPSLQLGLGDIARKVRNLGQGGSRPAGKRSRGADSRAHYLLAASGVNTASALRDLHAFTTDMPSKAPAPAPTPFDTDLDNYVDGMYRQSALNLIEQGLEQAKRDFDDFLEENVQMEWDSQRRRIYEHFGLVKKGDDAEAGFQGSTNQAARGAFGRSNRKGRTLGATAAAASFGPTKSILGATGTRSMRQSLFNDVAEKVPAANVQSAPEDRMLREKQDKYASKVKNLNIARLEEAACPVMHQFADVEAQPSLEDTSHFVNAYKALAEIVGEAPQSYDEFSGAPRPSDPGAVKERAYATQYLDDSPTSRDAFLLRKRILDGSRTFLEKHFLQQLETNIAKNAKEASLGGVPSTINKVRAYIRLRDARKELGAENVELQMLNDDYCWVLIFYLLRAGLVHDAATYVAENERAIKSMDRNFPNYLASYARSEDRRLSQDLQSRISSEYSQRARIAPENSVDPYRMACYKIIGRCELSRRNLEGIQNQSVEDYVWLQFSLAREVNRVEETAAEVFGLEDVRALIQDIGQRHFTSGSGEGAAAYGTYFFLQILAGQFESAVSWLYPHNYLTAVHFAIALDYYGLLRVNDFNGQDLLSYTTRQQPQISFGRMIGYYTRDFRASDATVAADYLTLICLNGDIPGEPGKRQTQLCHEALRELVLETREFAQLLGDIRADGQRIKGSIEQRLPLIRIGDDRAFLRHITISAAQIADDNGRVTDAVLLYHLAEEYDNVITICNRALSESISIDIGDAPLRLEPLKPRGADHESTPSDSPSTSLSLTAVEDPYHLTHNMLTLYESNALSAAKIKPAHRSACALLLGIHAAKHLVATHRWAPALDALHALHVLPIAAKGSIGVIRAHATAFASLPPVVARNVGNLLIWTIECCGRQREVLRQATFEVLNRKGLEEEILQVARDMMVFAGLVRYKLQPRVFEVLAKVGGDVGAY